MNGASARYRPESSCKLRPFGGADHPYPEDHIMGFKF
jgi:hypothetical protein